MTSVFIASLTNITAQTTADVSPSVEIPESESKPVLVVFTGSDWCIPCIRLEKKILEDPDFIHFSETYLTIVTADFPRAKKLSGETIRQNESLAEKYNPEGVFPLMVLLNSEQSVLGYVHYENQSTEEFILEIKSYFR